MPMPTTGTNTANAGADDQHHECEAHFVATPERAAARADVERTLANSTSV
jgi:hypothetical protein